MVAAVRPDSWDLPLFLHVFGAMVLFGALGSAAIVARASFTTVLPRAILFRILLVVAVPAWILMRAGAAWINSKEDVKGDPTWLGVGFGVSDFGVPILVIATGIAWWAAKRPERSWPRQVAGALAFIYLVMLGVAWWAMTAKPGA
jgi:hypothetical protein